MSTDSEKMVSHSADKQLMEIEKKYPGFIHTKSQLGVRLSYQLQTILQTDEIVRGSRIREQGEYPTALNGYLYSLLRGSRQQRRALALNMLKQFDEQVVRIVHCISFCDLNCFIVPFVAYKLVIYVIFGRQFSIFSIYCARRTIIHCTSHRCNDFCIWYKFATIFQRG